MFHEVNNLRANLAPGFFGSENSKVPAQKSSNPSIFEQTEPYEPVGTKIDTIEDDEGTWNLYALEELTVTGKAPKKQPLSSAIVQCEPQEIINKRQTSINAENLVAMGGKMQKREVNGQKQQIAILKDGKNEAKFLVNEDGTLGERLVTLSTRGKDKYITQSEHQRRINEVFPNGLPDGVNTNYAYRNGQYQLVVTPKTDIT